MTELEIEELERKVTVSDSVIAAEARSVEVLPDQVGKDVRNVLPEMGAEEQTDSLDAEEVAIVMEIAEVIERARKDKSISPYSMQMQENTDRKNSVLGHFSCSDQLLGMCQRRSY